MICDLAETYHIYNYRALSPKYVATLVFGLRENSRVKMFFSETKINLNQILLSIIADELKFLSWTKGSEAQKGKPYKAKRLLKVLQGENDNDDYEVFENIEDFENYMKQFIKEE